MIDGQMEKNKLLIFPFEDIIKQLYKAERQLKFYTPKQKCIMHPDNNATTNPKPIPIQAPLTWNI